MRGGSLQVFKYSRFVISIDLQNPARFDATLIYVHSLKHCLTRTRETLSVFTVQDIVASLLDKARSGEIPWH